MDEKEIERLDLLSLQRKWAWALGLSGLIPFVACALVAVALGNANPLTGPAVEIFRSYSVVILSFLGGIRWGHALLRRHDDVTVPERWTLLWSVVPSLVAWTTVFLEDQLAVGVLLIAFCAQGAWDSFSANADRLPKWFAPLRMVLTAIVAATHIAVFLVMLS